MLHDTKGKGVYDEAKVILEDELPASILLHDGWLYLSGRGTVRRYKQSKPGGDYDVKEIIAQGFCGYQHHQVSGLTIGNDGWLYITAGDDDNYVEGSDGSRVTVLRTGAIFRCRPDGSKMQLFSLGFYNPYRDVAFDAAGNMFHADNDDKDGGKFTGCRLMHVAEGNDFGWRLRTGRVAVCRISARGRLRRIARQSSAVAEDGSRHGHRPAHLQRHAIPGELSRFDLLPRCTQQADTRLQSRGRRRKLCRHP